MIIGATGYRRASSRLSATSACSTLAGGQPRGAEARGRRPPLHRLHSRPGGIGYMGMEAKRTAKAIAHEVKSRR